MSLDRLWLRFALAVLVFPAGHALGGPVVRIQDPDGDGIREIVLTPDVHTRPPRSKVRRKVDRFGNPLLGAFDSGASETVARATVAGTQVTLQVIGLSATWGSGPDAPPVPVRLEVCVRSNPDDPCTIYQPTFADLSELAEFETDSVDLGSDQALVVFRATAAYPDFNAPTWQRAVLSNTTNAIILHDGDNINSVVFQRPNPPTQNPFGDQQDIPYFLDQYLEPDGTVVLNANQWLMLFELGATNPASSAYDFQDLVILADISGGVVQQGDIYLRTVADGLAADSMLNPKSSFVWAMVRSAPGNSRIRGVFYSRDISFNAGNERQEFFACIETTHGWLDCGLATSPQLQAPVSHRDFPSGSTAASALIADMAITNMQTHAIGWKERTGPPEIYRYKVMFKTNGQPWGDGAGGTVPLPLGNYTETGAGETDIDIRSNDADKIGVLAYYGTVGSSEADGARLVLYVYDTPSLTQTRVVIVPSGGDISLPATGCSSNCFALAGDRGNSFHVFYNAPAGGTTHDLKVATVVDGAVSSTRTVGTFSPARWVRAGKITMGASLLANSGTSGNIYDVPTFDPIGPPRKTGVTWLAGLEGSEATNVVFAAHVATNFEAVQDRVILEKVSENPADPILNPQIDDPIKYHPSLGGPPQIQVCRSSLSTNVGDYCYKFEDSTAHQERGTVVAGNTHYSAFRINFLTWTTWPNPDRYFGNQGARIVIHQTPALYP